MTKVYLYQQKIFNYLGILLIIFGVFSCASSQTTTAQSGETDGVYYSPSKDGQVEYAQEEEANNYDIQVGSPYFDANGNGAEDFYYTQDADAGQDVNIYTGSNNIYLSDGSADWGRYDGIDVTVNNWGWNNPYWGWNGFYGWGWSWGWNNYYWNYPTWNPWYNSPYYGWGGYYGYNPYWNYYSPYWGYGGGYYNGYYGYPGYYYRGTPIRSGYRPGSNLAYSHNPGLAGVRRNSSPVRRTAISGIRSNDESIRPVRQTREIRPDSNIRTNSNQGSAGSIRNNDVQNGNIRSVRPVRETPPQGVRPNTPIRSNQNIRSNSNNPRTNIRSNSIPRNSAPTNSGIRTSSPTRSSGGMRSSSPAPSRSTGSSSGGGRRR